MGAADSRVAAKPPTGRQPETRQGWQSPSDRMRMSNCKGHGITSNMGRLAENERSACQQDWRPRTVLQTEDGYTGAIAVSSTRTSAGCVRTPVLSKTRLRWVRAVLAVICMRSAISVSVSPSAT